MKVDIPVPFQKISWFQGKIGFEEEDLRYIGKYSRTFFLEKDLFAEQIHQYFMEIPGTRLILGHGARALHLKKLWHDWFGLLFTESFNRDVLDYLWKSGLRHVEVNVDKRFINLGCAFVQQFCHRIALGAAPKGDQGRLLSALDKMVDFCVLIETHAYVTASSQCDMEVVKGISHQVRNPLTVIGGNILRLQRNLDPDNPLYMTYETILMENIFAPFFSLKPYGTGFGLPIARLAARKNLGETSLEAVPGRGTRCLIQLPVPSNRGLQIEESRAPSARGVDS